MTKIEAKPDDSSGMLKFDIHIHSRHSDGVGTPTEIAKQAKKIGLAGFALTDHDNMKGLKEAKIAAQNAGVIFIPGIEVTTISGDILAIGIEELPNTNDALELIDKIKQQGGVAILAHPFAGLWDLSFANLPDIVKRFSAVEIFNAMTHFELNMEAIKLAKQLDMTGTAGSDAHPVSEVGAAYTMSKDDDIIGAIRRGEVKVGWRV
ncbi:MAG: CehA/McbA family metallohydrolase [Candidatus Aenigmatarchaeota archaeon]